MIWGGCKNRVVVGLNLSISSLFVHVHSLCYSKSIKRSARVPLCSQTLPGMTASCSGLPQLPDKARLLLIAESGVRVPGIYSRQNAAPEPAGCSGAISLSVGSCRCRCC